MALENVPGWVADANAAVEAALDGFERRFGYEPDDNMIVVPGRVGILRQVETVAPEVSAFFRAVNEVSWPDIWNGYFLGPAPDISLMYHDPDGNSALALHHPVVQIGSDGGGALFGVEADGAVLQFTDPAVTNNVIQGTTRVVAPDFDTFLDLLLENVRLFGRDQTPRF